MLQSMGSAELDMTANELNCDEYYARGNIGCYHNTFYRNSI